VFDCYRRVVTPTRDFFEFSTYVSLFAQLVAGPIVRFRQIEPDLERIAGADPSWRERGWSFFALGLIKKVLIADTLAGFVDPHFLQPAALSTGSAWLAALGYTYQLYFDFSGYSDMAVGLGLLFGLRLPQNFNSPYRASDLADFWRRWHISLSTVLRDYLYVPLGGNRGARWKTYRNVMLTMLLGGIWHGASWTFVVWGAYHGLLLCGQRLLGGARLPALRRLVTFVAVVVGWVIFRSPSLTVAARMLGRMFSLHQDAPLASGWPFLALVVVAAGLAHLGPNTFELDHRWSWAAGALIVLLFALAMLVIIAGKPSPFLYFQF
jgi:alginate O-acetyltransferase complex protein AlgI